MSYGPEMTPSMRAKLQEEISQFDAKDTLAEIERNAVGGRDINAYQDWLEAQDDGGFDVQAEPDLLTDDQTFPYAEAGRLYSPDIQIFLAQFYEQLTPVQLKVWRLVMVENMTHEDAAFKLRVSQPVITRHIQAATKKLRALKAEQDDYLAEE